VGGTACRALSSLIVAKMFSAIQNERPTRSASNIHRRTLRGALEAFSSYSALTPGALWPSPFTDAAGFFLSRVAKPMRPCLNPPNRGPSRGIVLQFPLKVEYDIARLIPRARQRAPLLIPRLPPEETNPADMRNGSTNGWSPLTWCAFSSRGLSRAISLHKS